METPSSAHQEWTTTRTARRPSLGITVLFALFCWAPMFLVATSAWCLYAEPVLILIAAYCYKVHAINNHYGLRKMSWVAILGKRLGVLNPDYAFQWTWWTTIVACVAVLLLMTLVPPWSGWKWLFPAVAAIVHLLLIGLVYVEAHVVA